MENSPRYTNVHSCHLSSGCHGLYIYLCWETHKGTCHPLSSSYLKKNNLVSLGNLIHTGFLCQVSMIPEVQRSSDGGEDDVSCPTLASPGFVAAFVALYF